MKEYLALMRHVKEHGIKKEDRTGTGTISVFGYQMRFDLAEGFPLVTTKKCHLRSIIHELLWFLKGETNIAYLKEHGVSIWDEWATDEGELGPVYGHQWRSWTGADGQVIDQISDVIQQIKTNPDSRRLIVSAWNPAVLPEPGELIHTLGDAHLYLTHLEQTELQLSREPFARPQMRINPEVKDIFGFTYDDFTLENYQAHPHIKAPVAI